MPEHRGPRYESELEEKRRLLSTDLDDCREIWEEELQRFMVKAQRRRKEIEYRVNHDIQVCSHFSYRFTSYLPIRRTRYRIQRIGYPTITLSDYLECQVPNPAQCLNPYQSRKTTTRINTRGKPLYYLMRVPSSSTVPLLITDVQHLLITRRRKEESPRDLPLCPTLATSNNPSHRGSQRKGAN